MSNRPRSSGPPTIDLRSGHNECLFEFLRGHDRFRCELRDHGQWGVEAQFYQNGTFLYSPQVGDSRAGRCLVGR
jgi:hypothetical protein